MNNCLKMFICVWLFIGSSSLYWNISWRSFIDFMVIDLFLVFGLERIRIWFLLNRERLNGIVLCFRFLFFRKRSGCCFLIIVSVGFVWVCGWIVLRWSVSWVLVWMILKWMIRFWYWCKKGKYGWIVVFNLWRMW